MGTHTHTHTTDKHTQPQTTTTQPAPTTSQPQTTTTQPVPTTTQPQTTQNGCVDDSRWAGAQCGGYIYAGATYTGSSCCPTGLACHEVNYYYSGCFEQCWGSSWTCNNNPT